jgi:hypothetical protein
VVAQVLDTIKEGGMFDGKPMSNKKKQLKKLIAERALTRGRKTTAAESLENIRAFLAEGEPLGAEFEKVYDDNLDKLYER